MAMQVMGSQCGSAGVIHGAWDPRGTPELKDAPGSGALLPSRQLTIGGGHAGSGDSAVSSNNNNHQTIAGGSSGGIQGGSDGKQGNVECDVCGDKSSGN